MLVCAHSFVPWRGTVRAAYILKVKTVHPDVCKQPGTVDNFREVSRAYQILIDPQQRKMYDQGMSDDEIAAGSNRHRPTASSEGARQAYAGWKRDMFKFYCDELGIGDPYGYAARVRWQFNFALQSAWARDFSYAQRFVHDHSGLLVGLGVSTLVTGGVPIVCLTMYKLISVLDRHSDAMLRPGGIQKVLVANLVQPWTQLVNKWRRRANGAYARTIRRRGGAQVADGDGARDGAGP